MKKLFKRTAVSFLVITGCMAMTVSGAHAKKPIRTADPVAETVTTDTTYTAAVLTVAATDTAYAVDTTNTVLDSRLTMVRRVVVFNEGTTVEEKRQYVSAIGVYGGSFLMNLPIINGIVIRVPVYVPGATLADYPQVALVEASGQVVTLQADGGAADGGAADGGASAFVTPTELIPREDRAWGTLRLYEHAYDAGLISSVFEYMSLDPEITDAIFSEHMNGIRVAVFDTGVDISHRSLRRRIAGGVDLVGMAAGIPTDDNGHGTHVAGTLCGDGIGIVHYDPLQLFSVKVLDQNAAGDVSTLAMGLQWAINNQMDIINLSVAYAEESPVLRLAIQKASEAGIIMVAAAGNHSNWDVEAPVASADGGAADGGAADGGAADGGAADGGAADGGAAIDGTAATNPYPVMYPAAYPEVVAVGAMDAFNDLASFSNTGPEVDLLAPGTDIFSTDMGGGYGLCSGTSMAAPHVTGAVAMMLSRARDIGRPLPPAEVARILVETADGGVINLVRALQEVVYGYH